MKERLLKLEGFLNRHVLPFGAALSLLASALVALWNVSLGPLHNLNDIGGWRNRALFIALCALAQTALMLLLAARHRKGFLRMLLREGILAAGFVILLGAINHKSYAYVNQLLPLVRAMDAGGLAAGLATESAMTAPAVGLLYLLTRGPVYPLYMMKLAAIVCQCLLALMAMRAADEAGLGLRAEAALLLCLLLPQGFLNAAFVGQIEMIAATALALAVFMGLGGRQRACAAFYGIALALSGAALYALPLMLCLAQKKKLDARLLALSAGIAVCLCLPGIVASSPKALLTLLHAPLGSPAYAAGSPCFAASLIARPLPGEMPEMFMLRHVAETDFVTNAQPFFTPEHSEILQRGLAIAQLGAYGCLCAMEARDRTRGPEEKGFALALAALLLCPGAGSAMWMPLCAYSVFLILERPAMRLPASLVLFATAGAAAYPAVEEILLPMPAAFLCCLAALLMSFGILPGKIKK